MRSFSPIAIAGFLILIAVQNHSIASVPQLISFQGKLADTSGNPVPDGSHSLTFSIYSVSGGGSPIWSETQPSVPVADGIFSVLLGSVISLHDTVFAETSRWLGISVEGGTELVPRTQIVSVPFSERVNTVDGASGGAIDGNVSVTGAIDATGQSSKIRFHYDTFGSLPSPLTYHGMFAHVHAEGKAYYAHAGEWVSLAREAHSHSWLDASDGTPSQALSMDAGGNMNVTGKATIGPGNTNTGANAFVVGESNMASGVWSSISGGFANAATDSAATVGGGRQNSATGRSSTVSGGHGNIVSTHFGAVGGGFNNSVGNEYGTIAGGGENWASGLYSSVGGGHLNRARGDYSVIGGGGGPNESDSNLASGAYSTIGGGSENIVSGNHGTIGGGMQNRVGSNGVVAGGWGNNCSGSNSAISGGRFSLIFGSSSTIAGGENDTITFSASQSMIFGGTVYLNSFRRVAFYEGDNPGFVGINRDDHDGGILYPLHIGTDTFDGNGAFLTAGGVWTDGSSRTFKENFSPVGGSALIEKISGLPVESYNYKNSTEKHIGPMAEDFVAAFDVGAMKQDGVRENQYLSALDVAGVSLAGVKELIIENKELKRLILDLEKRVTELEANR